MKISYISVILASWGTAVSASADDNLRSQKEERELSSSPPRFLRKDKQPDKYPPIAEIVGGVEVNPPFKYPFMVRAGGCGASLVAPNVLLCAAHCQNAFNQVQIGRHNLNDGTEEYETFGILEKVPHPDYGGVGGIDYDYMMVKLDGNSNFAPVELDNGEIALTAGKDVVVMGWGATSSGGTTSSVLLEVEVDLWSTTDCRNAYGSSSITDRMVCAARSGKDSCQGDSGGPIIDKDTGKQIGIVSWGSGCADANYPGVYAKVQDQIGWINNYIDLWYIPCTVDSDCDDSKVCTTDTCDAGVCKNEYDTCSGNSYCEESTGLCTGTCTDFGLVLNTDNYASETSWEVSSQERGVVASGDGYGNNNQYTYNDCLPMNEGTFMINDSYGDGICCGYGQGSYSISFGSSFTHNGDGQFGSSETIDLVLSPTTPAPVPPITPAPVPTTPAPVLTTPVPVPTTPAPVLTTPAPVPTTPAPVPTTPAPTTPAPTLSPVELFFESFDDGYIRNDFPIAVNNGNEDGTWAFDTNGFTYKDLKIVSDSKYIRIKRQASIISLNSLDVSAYGTIQVEYRRRVRNLDDNEYFYIEWSTDNFTSEINELEKLGKSGPTSFANSSVQPILKAEMADPTNFKLRFRTVANEGKERGDVDDIKVIGNY